MCQLELFWPWMAVSLSVQLQSTKWNIRWPKMGTRVPFQEKYEWRVDDPNLSLFSHRFGRIRAKSMEKCLLLCFGCCEWWSGKHHCCKYDNDVVIISLTARPAIRPRLGWCEIVIMWDAPIPHEFFSLTNFFFHHRRSHPHNSYHLRYQPRNSHKTKIHLESQSNTIHY